MTTEQSQEPLEFGASRDEAEVCVLLMHGLGADGHDFADVAEVLSRAALPRKWRFVLPHAPQMEVTFQMGTRMPAWYDILNLEQPRAVDWDTVRQSQVTIETLLDGEPAPKVVLAGFSQGAAMALHVGLRRQESVAGVLMMSGYMLESDEHPCPQKGAGFPIGIFHGNVDPIVPLIAAEHTQAVLAERGFAAAMKVYDGMAHSVCEEEVRDVFDWLKALD